LGKSCGPVKVSCAAGKGFDGYYPSFMSPGHAAGHLGLTRQVFFMNGCNPSRLFQSRTFTITAN
jgi:hypothetical protein